MKRIHRLLAVAVLFAILAAPAAQAVVMACSTGGTSGGC